VALPLVWKNRVEKNGRGNLAGKGQRGIPSGGTSAQKWLLKGELKIADQIRTAREDRLEMFDGVAERIGLGTGRGFLLGREPGAQVGQPMAQPLQEVINRFQGKRQAQPLDGGFNAGVGQQLDQEFAQQHGADSVARQNVRQEDGESASASAALSAVGAKHPLAPGQAALGLGRIIAVEQTVPVQRFISAAAWTALLFEKKSSSWSFSGPRTKRNGWDMERLAAGRKSSGRDFFCGAADGATRFRGGERKRGRGA
jgi:hypothetical protein